jgi:tetratricopeptide (TPR) repeat protein
MANSYFTWDDFVNNFAGQMVSAEDIYTNMVKGGLKEHSLLEFDFHFVSNERKNVEALGEFLQKHYSYKLKPIIERDDNLWELTGVTNMFPVTAENLMYWILDMYKRGYEFDSELDGYGAPYDPDNQALPDFDKEKEDYYFDLGLERYNSGDLSGAISNWSNVLVINDKEVNSYYSRAIVKDELYTWKLALKDYDKAIEIAPNFISALLNRGSLKDENRDYEGAIHDYELVINHSNADDEDLKKAYFNRGNTYFNLDNNAKACKDWKKSAELGADYALERVQKYCEMS